MTEQEISNELVRKLDNRDDLKEMNDYIKKVWAVLPDLCKAVQDNNSRENYIPDMGVVVDMLRNGNYVREAVDVILEKLAE